LQQGVSRQWTYGNLLACSTDMINSTEDHLHQKCQIQDYQNKDRLSVCRLLILQRKCKLGHM